MDRQARGEVMGDGLMGKLMKTGKLMGDRYTGELMGDT